jgi:hypothetical protein
VGGLGIGGKRCKWKAKRAEQQAGCAAGKSIHSFSNLFGCPLGLASTGEEVLGY